MVVRDKIILRHDNKKIPRQRGFFIIVNDVLDSNPVKGFDPQQKGGITPVPRSFNLAEMKGCART